MGVSGWPVTSKPAFEVLDILLCPLLESKTKGVSAPLSFLTRTGSSSVEENDDPEGVVIPLRMLLPFVAAIDGDAGGSGDRVK